MSTERFFGLDLSGYSGDRSSLAEVGRSHEYFALVYRKHPFSRSAKGWDRLAHLVAAERDAVTLLLRKGTLLVDIPLDLQSLPSLSAPVFVWQLTARPVDLAYGGLRPLADRIGAPAARFRYLLAEPSLKETLRRDRLLETYPAASLLCSGASYKGYKRQTTRWDKGHWVGGDTLAKIARALRLVADAPITLTDDDVDAIICALAGATPDEAALQGETLAADMRTRLATKIRRLDAGELCTLDPPTAYRLFKRLPDTNVRVQLCDWPPRN